MGCPMYSVCVLSNRSPPLHKEEEENHSIANEPQLFVGSDSEDRGEDPEQD